MKFFLLAVPCLLLPNCSFNTTLVSLDYQPKLGQSIPGPKVVSAGTFADYRQSGEFTLGSVRSAIGTPLDTLNTRVPVAQIVRNAFAHGLKARGMLATDIADGFILSGEVLILECSQMTSPSATARIRVNLVRASTGEITYSRVFQSVREGGTYAPGSGSPVPALTELTSRALQSVVDQALDDRELRRRLQTVQPGTSSLR